MHGVDDDLGNTHIFQGESWLCVEVWSVAIPQLPMLLFNGLSEFLVSNIHTLGFIRGHNS